MSLKVIQSHRCLFGEKREINQDFVLEKSVDTLCVAENVSVDSTKLKRTYNRRINLLPLKKIQ